MATSFYGQPGGRGKTSRFRKGSKNNQATPQDIFSPERQGTNVAPSLSTPPSVYGAYSPGVALEDRPDINKTLDLGLTDEDSEIEDGITRAHSSQSTVTDSFSRSLYGTPYSAADSDPYSSVTPISGLHTDFTSGYTPRSNPDAHRSTPVSHRSNSVPTRRIQNLDNSQDIRAILQQQQGILQKLVTNFEESQKSTDKKLAQLEEKIAAIPRVSTGCMWR